MHVLFDKAQKKTIMGLKPLREYQRKLLNKGFSLSIQTQVPTEKGLFNLKYLVQGLAHTMDCLYIMWVKSSANGNYWKNVRQNQREKKIWVKGKLDPNATF